MRLLRRGGDSSSCCLAVFWWWGGKRSKIGDRGPVHVGTWYASRHCDVVIDKAYLERTGVDWVRLMLTISEYAKATMETVIAIRLNLHNNATWALGERNSSLARTAGGAEPRREPPRGADGQRSTPDACVRGWARGGGARVHAPRRVREHCSRQIQSSLATRHGV